MNGYLIARFDMTDAEAAKTAYPDYVAAAGPAYKTHHAHFLVRGGAVRATEGTARARNVVIEFPSLADAMACYKSDVYQAARAHRLPVAEGEIVIAEGAVKAHPVQTEPRGYWIARQDVHDTTIYKKYVEQSAAAFTQYGAVFLVRGGPHQAMEGQARARNVLIEFPSVQHAIDCLTSDVYRAAGEYRRAAATGEIVIVDGAPPA